MLVLETHIRCLKARKDSNVKDQFDSNFPSPLVAEEYVDICLSGSRF